MFIVVLALLGLIEMLLWNALIPDLFHGPELSYWQALGLLLLVRIFVGFRGPKRRWWKHLGRKNAWKQEWKHSWKEDCIDWKNHGAKWDCGPSSQDWNLWAKMTPEERANAKQEWKQAKEAWKEQFKQRFKPGSEL